MKVPKINPDKLGNVILIISCVLYMTHCGSSKVIKEDNSSIEHLLKINTLENKVYNQQNEILKLQLIYEKDTSIINNYSLNELDSIITARYK